MLLRENNSLFLKFKNSFLYKKICYFIDYINGSKNLVFYLSLVIFLLITLPLVINHIPHFDEATTWMITRKITFTNYFNIMQKEGHGIIWYLLLMPFAKNNLFYPYSMTFLNYIFCLLSVIYMWKKAPLDNIIKIIITFSFIYLFYFAPIARCYSIGLLGLFILAYHHKTALEKPYLYSLLLGLTFSTSLMVGIPSSYFGFNFIIELWKKRLQLGLPKIISIISILASMVFFFFLPLFIGGDNIVTREVKTFHQLQTKFLEFFYPLENIIFPFAFILLIIYIYKNSNKFGRCFLLYTFFVLSFFLIFIYDGELHHRLFYLVYIIIALWLNFEKLQKNKILIYSLMAIVFFCPFDFKRYYATKFITQFTTHIKKFNDTYSNSYLFFSESQIRVAIEPYLLFDETIHMQESLNLPNDYSIQKKHIRKTLEDFSQNCNLNVFVISHQRIEEWTKNPNIQEKIYKNRYIYQLKHKNN